mmetsp:Transcript_17216/g.38786  ORF Transcript_17216/g.38786 Transcript_17216/m.38786 type:complete len:183 (-) Transcript_17216:153-701(-)|eukprot:CAMPEP_0113323806 /NCGR_PEP_ID=MMETSP0010_2-20120614/16578_1 /TAXON_ID=216773 ORGANISM="Corethron hystrix, Strain 308" /NCGR_SAMPLE_ID=MMETSP0010_2 /ASSEMBLY_ACC=CAM_ASM_000155 /LENGTH=182 /DNA_ID=CAMNT_0000182883 /DNA_START=127 /DNA_END=675 /DNA_ORIENTATION=+ /assembly_acc=CAM_ASM_000155
MALRFASISQKLPPVVRSAPFPFFGSVSRATNFVEHNLKSIPRFLGWAVSAPLILSFVAFPAVVHNLEDEYRPSWLPNSPPTAASSAPLPMADREQPEPPAPPVEIELDDEAKAAIAKAHLSHGHGGDAGYKKSVDALRRFSTKPGAKYPLVDDENLWDKMPIPPGMEHPFADDDDDDDDDE